MRILCVHNRYQYAGGEGAVFDAEIRMLRSAGHEVLTYEETNARIGDIPAWQAALRGVWSRETYRRIRTQLREAPCEIVHVTNFNPLISPSVFYAAKRSGAATVQSLHNYRLLCPGAYFMRDARPCEDCLTRRLKWPAVQHGCYRDHRGASAAITAMLAVHRGLGTWTREIDAYIALTDFSRGKYIAGGLPAQQIHVKPNFLEPSPHPGSSSGEFAIFVGRLSEEKGILDLLSVWSSLTSPIPLRVYGDGPLEALCRDRAAGCETIHMMGRQDQDSIHEAMRNAAFLVLPSRWYECFPMTLLECFATGCPVLVPGFGGMAELVEDHVNGLHFQPLDPADMKAVIEWAIDHRPELEALAKPARAKYEQSYMIQTNYEQLMAIYAAALARRDARQRR